MVAVKSMLIYNINLIVVIIFSYLAYHFRCNSCSTNLYGDKKPLIWFSLFVIFSLSLVSGLRFMVGTDYITYAILYNDANTFSVGSSWVKDLEIGFILLCKMCYFFTKTPFLMFFVTSLIINAMVVLSLRNNSNNFWLSCYLYITTNLYYSTFNTTRQSIALAILFLGTGFLMRKEMWKYFVCVGIASLFHISAIIMIPVYFVVHFRAWSPFMWFLALADVLVLIFYDQFVSLIFVFLENTHYSEYESTMLLAAEGANVLRIFVFLAPLLLAFIFRKKISQAYPNSNVIINMCFIGLLIMLIASKQIYFARVSQYFNVYILFLVPFLISVFKDRRLRAVVTIVIMLCFLAHSYVLLPRDSDVLPYMSILDAPHGWNIFDYISRYQ